MNLKLIFIIIFTFISDQITKWLIIKNIEPYKEVLKVSPFLNIIHIRNIGIAFGLLSDKGNYVQPLFIIFTILAIVALFYYHFRSTPSFLKTVACGLIIGGALGNLLDRLIYGNVVDFIDMHIGHYHWPAFNIADSAISVGIFLLFIQFCREGN